MIIKTINPITIGGKRISKPSKYLSADGGDDDFYGADKSISSGTPTTTPTPTAEPTKQEEVEQAKKGKVWDKAKGWVTSGKAADLLKQVQAAGGIKGFLQGFLGGGNAGGGSTEGNAGGGAVITTPPPSTEDDKNKWSTGKKIAIFGGGAAVLGLIIYFATRGNK